MDELFGFEDEVENEEKSEIGDAIGAVGTPSSPGVNTSPFRFGM